MANVGDSRAILCRATGNANAQGSLQVFRLSEEGKLVLVSLLNFQVQPRGKVGHLCSIWVPERNLTCICIWYAHVLFVQSDDVPIFWRGHCCSSQCTRCCWLSQLLQLQIKVIPSDHVMPSPPSHTYFGYSR